MNGIHIEQYVAENGRMIEKLNIKHCPWGFPRHSGLSVRARTQTVVWGLCLPHEGTRPTDRKGLDLTLGTSVKCKGLALGSWSLPIKPPDLIKDKFRQKAEKTDYADRKQAEVVKSVALTPISSQDISDSLLNEILGQAGISRSEFDRH